MGRGLWGNVPNEQLPTRATEVWAKDFVSDLLQQYGLIHVLDRHTELDHYLIKMQKQC